MLKKEYDFVCSLGANCSAANQIRYRNLRRFALPFDWTWFNSAEVLNKIAAGFENNFCEFMQKDKLRKLEENEYSLQHNDRYQYQDINTRIYYYNHFYKTRNKDKEKDRVIKIKKKRCKRFIDYLERAENVLIVLSVNKEIDIESVKNLVKVLRGRFLNTNIDVFYQAFNAKENESLSLSNLEIRKYQRPENDYGYNNNNFEWRFLDEIKLSNMFEKQAGNFFKTTTIKKGIRISILNKISTAFYLKLYLFGARLQFVIGKNRIE